MPGPRVSIPSFVPWPTVSSVPLLLPMFLASLALVAGACRPPDPGSNEPGAAEVVSVIDGDTVILRMAGREETVRLLGVDAPESVHPSVPVQCFGPEASTRLNELLPPGTRVEVAQDEEPRDRYGRLLLFVTRSDDGTFVNLALVDEGLADAVSYAPNTALVGRFNAARNRARAAGLGLWGTCDGPDQPLE